MSDFESIEIEIESSAKGTNKELDGIDKALENIQGSLKGITDILSGLNGKIAPISRAMNRLAGDIEKINPDVFRKVGNNAQKSADEISDVGKRIGKAISDTANELKGGFGIKSKEGIDKVKEALNELYGAVEKFNTAQISGNKEQINQTYLEYQNISKELERLIGEYGTFKKAVDEADQQLLDLVRTSSAKIYISPEIKAEWKDDFAQMRSELGKAFTSAMPKGAFTEFDSFMQEIRDIQPWRNFSDNSADAFGQLVETIRNAKGETMSLGDAMRNGLADTKEIGDTVSYISDGFLKMAKSVAEAQIYSGKQLPAMRETVEAISEGERKLAELSRVADEAFNRDLGIGRFAEQMRSIADSLNVEQLKQLPAVIQDAIGGLPSIITDGFRNVPMVIEKAFFDGFESVERYTGEVVDDIKNELATISEFDWSRFIPDDKWNEPAEDLKNVADEANNAKSALDWSNALEQVAQLNSQYENFAKLMGEANAEMQIAVNTQKILQSAFSSTYAANMPWDTERMREGAAMLQEATNKVNALKDSFNSLNQLSGTNATPLETWKTVFEDIDRINNSFNGLSEKIGEANAEMSNLVDIRNRLNKAFSDTDSSKLPWDNESMQRGYQLLKEVNEKIEQVKSNLKDPDKLELDVEQPKSEIEKLIARMKELKSQISSMENMEINFTNADYSNAYKELGKVQDRINEIQGKKKDSNTTEWLAQIIAIQHELEKASALFNKWGDMAKNAFMKALTPLKLFKHEFEEIKSFVTRIGSGFAMISKPITKVFRNFQKSAQESFAKIQKAWAKVMRTFTFMLVRKAITAVITNISDATKSLAAFSKDIGTSFNGTMSLLTSDFRYLGASLVAAFEPILNYVTPILDKLVDSLVAVINKVNMFLAVLTNSKSYTIAKKKIIDYTDATKDANKAVKQLTMGIDELNILNDSSYSSSNSDEDYFDWEELTTPQLDLPDWIKQIKDLIDAFVNAFKKAWDNVGDFLLDAFKHLIDSVKGLISDIIRDLTRLFNSEEFQAFLETILRIIGKIAELIATIVDRIREAWNYNDLGYRILQDILAILQTIATHIENMLDNAIAWASELDFVPLFEAVEKALRQVNYAVDQIGYVVEDLFDLFLKLGTYLIEDWAPRLIGVFGNVAEGIGNIAGQIHEAWTELDFGTNVADAIDDIMDELIKHLESISVYFIEWAKQLDFKPIMNAFTELLESLKPVADFIGGVFEDIVEDYILPTVKHILEKIVPDIMKAISHFADSVDWDKLRENLDKLIKAFQTLSANIGEGVAIAIDEIGQAVANFVNSKDFQDFCDNLAKFMERITPEMVAKILVGIAKAILKIIEALVKFFNSEAFQSFLDKLIKFMENTSSDKIADILLNIAKAIVAFKFASFISKGFANFMTFLTLIGKLKEVKTLKTLAEQIKKIGENASGAGKAAETAGKLGKKASETAGGGLGSLATKIGGVTAMVGGTTLAVGSFVEMWQNGWSIIGEILKDLGIAIAAVGAVLLGLVTGPVAAVIAGVVAAVSTIAILIHDHWDEITQGWEDFKKNMSEKWEGFKETASEKWGAITGAIRGKWDEVTTTAGEYWQGLSDTIATKWEDFKTTAGEKWQGIKDAVYEKWQGISEEAQTKWGEVSTTIATEWDNFTTTASEKWQGIKDTIYEKWENLKEDATAKWGEISTAISETWDGLKETATEKWQGVRQAISDKWGEIKTDAGEWWEKISTDIGGRWNNFKQNAAGTWDEIKGKISETWSGINERWDGEWNTISTTVQNWWANVKQDAQSGWDDAVSFVENVWGNVNGWWDGAWSTIQGTLGGWWGNIRDDAQHGWDDTIAFVGGLWDDVNTWWDETWGGIHGTLSTWWGEIRGTASTKFEAVRGAIAEKWDAIQADIPESWHEIGKTLEEKWTGIKENAGTVFGELAGTVKDAWGGIQETVGSALNSIGSFISGLGDKMSGFIKLVKDAISNVTQLGNKQNDLGGGSHSGTPFWQAGFATGGFPEDGWFRASHGEIMGRFDNGQSVVANNNQITDGIAQAVSSSLVPILQDIAASNREVANKDFSVDIDSREIARASSMGQSKRGRSLINFT